jgi:hypothetical protein
LANAKSWAGVKTNAKPTLIVARRTSILDDTVASTKLELARDDNGGRILRRTYRFEFSETGNNWREGEVIMLGERVESVTLEPYEILE